MPGAASITLFDGDNTDGVRATHATGTGWTSTDRT
jgi:hypothetical protein